MYCFVLLPQWLEHDFMVIVYLVRVSLALDVCPAAVFSTLQVWLQLLMSSAACHSSSAEPRETR